MTLLRRGMPGEDVLGPTLVIWGERDRALSPELLDGLDTWVPGLRIERLPDRLTGVERQRQSSAWKGP